MVLRKASFINTARSHEKRLPDRRPKALGTLLNTNTIYAAVQKEAQADSYKSDPEYIAFGSVINRTIDKCNVRNNNFDGDPIPHVAHRKLYGAWYIAKTVRENWLHPTKTSQDSLIFTLVNGRWEIDQVRMAIVAWWDVHHRKTTDDAFRTMTEQVDQVGEARNKKRMQVLKQNKQKRRQNSLRSKIIVALTEFRTMTTKHLSTYLNATGKSISCHLARLVADGVVVRPVYGSYSLAPAKFEIDR